MKWAGFVDSPLGEQFADLQITWFDHENAYCTRKNVAHANEPNKNDCCVDQEEITGDR